MPFTPWPGTIEGPNTFLVGKRVQRRMKRTGPKLIAGVTAMVMLMPGGMALAQQVVPIAKPWPTPLPSPTTTDTPALVQGTPVPVATPLPLPRLNPKQMVELRGLLTDAGVAQGLRRVGTSVTLPADNDGMVRLALDYAKAVHSGRLAEADFDPNWGLRPPAYDPLPSFSVAVANDKLADWVRALPPPYTGYDGLKAGLDHYRQIEANGGWKTLPAADIAAGATGANVAALRQRLALEDAGVSLSTTSYDDELTEAVKRAQRRYGLPQTGTLDKATRAMLDVPVRDRIHQIMANMERWRWLPDQLPAKRIQVNIATAVLTVYDGDLPIASMIAVTGKPGTETPMLSSTINSIVINPPWNVPTSIATRELWPKEKKSPGYLARNGFKVIPLPGGGNRLQQQAGDSSALGRFKFDFDNKYSVYLHDTPAKAAFGRFDRLASHGCVRLSKPRALADLLLQGSADWTPDAVDAALAKGDTVRAAMPQPVAVFLLYWTAFAGADGSVSFRGDPYGWDKSLAAKIETRADAQQIAAK